MCSLKLLFSCRVRLGSLRLAIWQSVSQSSHQPCLTLCDLSCVWLFVTPKYMACVICISGTADVPGCGHRLHSRGVGMPGPRSAGLVQGCDVRELRDPGLLGWGQLPSRIPFPPLGLVPAFLERLLEFSASTNTFRSLLSSRKWVFVSLERKPSWRFSMILTCFFHDVICLLHSNWISSMVLNSDTFLLKSHLYYLLSPCSTWPESQDLIFMYLLVL